MERIPGVMNPILHRQVVGIPKAPGFIVSGLKSAVYEQNTLVLKLPGLGDIP